MNDTTSKSVRIWLYVTCFSIALLVVFGGFVRLTRSGLSIVEWNVITGVLPPIGEAAWQAEFAKYQQTPEFQIVNKGMTLDEYKRIYYVEYLHRLIGRLVGLVYVLPLFYFLIRGTIPWRKSWPYLVIGLGFAFQGALGWYMVASGLVDKPRVSQYRLAAHLITALGLLALTFWIALRNHPRVAPPGSRRSSPEMRRMSVGLLVLLLIQIAYGAFVAGLQAGHVSNTWPLMFGRFVPPGLLSVQEPWYVNLTATAVTVHFIHRWFAFIVFGYALWMYSRARKIGTAPAVLKTIQVILWILGVQITLGVLVVLFNVAISLALIHQAMGMAVFLTEIFLLYQVFAHQAATAEKRATLQEGVVHG